MYVERTLSLGDLTESSFLFGCRQAGKSRLLKETVKCDLYVDLLDRREWTRYLSRPEILYLEAEAMGGPSPLIVVDEIQKVPGLLDTVHRAIEAPFRARFILTGSSARKLKRTHANMLGGRAVTRHLFPLSFFELGESRFNLDSFLRFGGLPRVCLSESDTTKKQLLRSYVATYLKEEIHAEGLTSNLPAFSRFLDLAGAANGSVVNYSAISQEVGVSAKTVKEYFAILEDTLIGFILPAYGKSHRKRLVGHPKFYFVDTGVAAAVRRMLGVELVEGTELYGQIFEHFIVTETCKAVSYLDDEIDVSFFRTSDGAEVDLVLEKHGLVVPIEIKSSTAPRGMTGMKSFLSDHECHRAYCVCRTPRRYTEKGVVFVPWQDFVAELNGGGLFAV